VNDPLVLSSAPLANGNYNFFNANGQLTSKGFETNLKISVDDLSLYIGYTYIDAKREFDNANLFNPLTARHRINANVMYEIENKLRVAYELFYIGQQYLSTGELTRDYWVMGISVQRNFNKLVCLLTRRIFWIHGSQGLSPYIPEASRTPSLETFILQPMDLFSMADLSYPSECV